MKSILEIEGLTKPSYEDKSSLSLDQVDMTTETSNIEDFASAESSDEIEVYIRPNKDGRFVVRMGNFIVCIFGTEAEGFFLSRMELSTKFHNEPIFSLDQISKGNLQFVKNPPQGLMDAISKLIIEFPAIADELQTYNPYG